MNPYSVNKKRKARVVVLFDTWELKAIDQAGIAAQMPSRAATIRLMVRDAMTAKGPAGAPTPPSHGSNIPQKENADEHLNA